MITHISGGGSNYIDALKKSSVQLKLNPSKDKCVYLISDYLKTFSESSEDMSKDEFAKYLFNPNHGKGGSIIFSINVNISDIESPTMISWLTNKYNTLKNKFSVRKTLDKIRRTNNINAWTIGRYLEGVYTSNITNETFSEKSIVISILDCDRKTLFKLAKEIREQFKQESVLVYDASNKQFYFVDAK